MLTIIIPVYNAEETIRRTLDSLKNQTSSNYKVIIINDGSTDDSQKIIYDQIQDLTNFQLLNQKNKGVSYARNLGIKLANTEYISFLDADDTYERQFIEEFERINKLFKPEVVAFGFRTISKNKVFEKVSKYELNRVNYLKNKNTPNTNSWIIRKQLIDHHYIKFDSDISWGEDMLFFYKILYHSKDVYYEPKVMSNNYNVEDSLSKYKYSNIKSKLIWIERIKAMDKNKQVNKLCNYYLIPGTILSESKNNNNLLNEYRSYFFNLYFPNGMRSLKQKLTAYYYFFQG